MRVMFCVLAVAALTSCGVDDEQLAATGLYNGPSKSVRACYGEPDKRIPVGVEQIWVYDVGRLHVEGWLAALGLSERPTFSAPTPDCQARFTIDSHGVRGIDYTDVLGHAIPQGETCDIGIRKCLDRLRL